MVTTTGRLPVKLNQLRTVSRPLVACLAALAVAQGAVANEPADLVRDAVEKGLIRLEKGSANYLEHRQCFSCHHQALSVLPLVAARQRGFTVNAAHLKKQIAFTVDSFLPKKDEIAKGNGIDGGTTTAGYALLTLDAAGHPADETTAALVEYVLRKQAADGAWVAQAERPPIEGSKFTATGLALSVLRAYSPPEAAKDTVDLRERINRACAKGLAWLQKSEPKTTEDKVFRLRGLVSGGAEKKEIEAARTALEREQREDGSWSQSSDLPGDAYATGTVLTALRGAGLPADAEVYRKGVKYLLSTQRPDGAWIVPTRSKPVQKFFDNGDPGDKAQFVSFAATGWATLALLETLPVK
jgi:N-acyl-D-amino-acid deacylase